MTEGPKNKDISLPPGYEPVNVKDTKDRPELHDHIRHLRDNLYFLFDPENSGYLEYLAQCRKDTKDLAKALQRELDKRQIAVWAKGGRTPGLRRNHPKINIMIRPPFLKSFVTTWEKSHDRMKKNDRCDNLVLHVDPRHQLQMVRYSGAETEQSFHIMKINSRRFRLANTVSFYLENMEHIYGQWEVMAQKIADAIEKPLSIEELRQLENPSTVEP